MENTSQRLRHGTCLGPGPLEMRPETRSTCTQEKPVRGEECGIWNGEKLGEWFRRRLVSIRPSPHGELWGLSCAVEAVLAEKGAWAVRPHISPSCPAVGHSWGGLAIESKHFWTKQLPAAKSYPLESMQVCAVSQCLQDLGDEWVHQPLKETRVGTHSTLRVCCTHQGVQGTLTPLISRSPQWKASLFCR